MKRDILDMEAYLQIKGYKCGKREMKPNPHIFILKKD